MSSIAEIRLWGSTIGAISLASGEDIATFEYSPDFAQSGIEVSPISMPLSRNVYRFPSLRGPSFHGLPGLVSDSLPDRFGNALIDSYLARQGRPAASFNAIERLCYIGKRGMGALEFLPSIGPQNGPSERLDVALLVELASEILNQRETLNTAFLSEYTDEAVRLILRIGSSAGGARAKALIAWNPQTQEVRSGQVSVPEGFEHWLLKFDGVESNRDKELSDPLGYGAIEYAYYLMAINAGIEMSECRLLEEGRRRHFMTRRFDRTPKGEKLHMQSLGALGHFDFNLAGAYSYEQAFILIRQLGLGIDSIEEQFRRMLFNILARNQDDHVKNIAFLMDKKGSWRLAPAFDVVYSYNPSGAWTATHQMSLAGKRDNFTLEDFRQTAKNIGMKRGRSDTILAEVQRAVSQWPEFAGRALVSEERTLAIKQSFRSFRSDR
ncbi:type II toxin-antitoxin system HipA family toxin [Treponema sp.]